MLINKARSIRYLILFDVMNPNSHYLNKTDTKRTNGKVNITQKFNEINY